MLTQSKRIMVIGCPGSGKSTLSRELHKKTNLPLYYLDMLYWNEDKTTVDSDIFKSRLNEVLSYEKWIIDGNYQSTMELRMKACDTIIFLDYDVNTCLSGIKQRQGKKREDMPWIEDKDDLEFINFIKKFNEVNRPSILDLLKKYKDKKILIFKNRDEVNQSFDIK